jgi:ABC-type uncharacterized transport system YnjBCD ATPase subunit
MSHADDNLHMALGHTIDQGRRSTEGRLIDPRLALLDEPSNHLQMALRDGYVLSYCSDSVLLTIDLSASSELMTSGAAAPLHAAISDVLS